MSVSLSRHPPLASTRPRTEPPTFNAAAAAQPRPPTQPLHHKGRGERKDRGGTEVCKAEVANAFSMQTLVECSGWTVLEVACHSFAR